jgi:membrane associated rhomboid family serine protease
MFLLPVSRYECERTPAVTIGFVVSISLLWFCLWATSYPQSVFAEFGFIASQPNPLSLLSSLFLHHGILYLLPNAMFLFIFGKQVEDAFWHLLLLGIFIASGLAGTGLFYVDEPDENRNYNNLQDAGGNLKTL